MLCKTGLHNEDTFLEVVHANLSENHRPLVKNTRYEFTGHTADPLIFVPISVPIFLLFLRRKIAEKISNENLNKVQGGTFPWQIWDPSRQGGLHMNAGSGVSQIFTSMTIYTSRSLEAYPITMPPPKGVSDRMCPTVIHE